MAQTFIAFFSAFPPLLATFLMAMFPIAERFALPVAVAGFHLPIWEAFLIVVIGNMIPVTAILFLAEKFHIWISKNDGIFGRTWVKSLAHAQAKFARYEKWGLIGLLIFLSVPTPFNGAFTASLIAFILGYPMKKSLPYLFGGVVFANIVALSLTVGLDKFF